MADFGPPCSQVNQHPHYHPGVRPWLPPVLGAVFGWSHSSLGTTAMAIICQAPLGHSGMATASVATPGPPLLPLLLTGAQSLGRALTYFP